jgi:Tfp pilus assembly protein PilF
MRWSPFVVAAFALPVLSACLTIAQQPAGFVSREQAYSSSPPAAPSAKPQAAGAQLPLCGLAPAKLAPNLCSLKYRVSTSSPECQAFFDQGLGYLYSYVWMEASRSFETATQKDPECALAWWGLSRALDRWAGVAPDKGDPLRAAANKALQKAHDFRERAGHREQLLIQARMQEKGLPPYAGGSTESHHKAAVETIDTLISLFDDDEEAWFYRAQLSGGERLFGGSMSSAPFYKALLRINPLHPGANHELLHHSENIQRPALGWLNAEKYIESSPGIPHAFHMQAHLATRLGRWDKTSDRSAHAIELERAYHKEMNVQPQEDHQFSHHLEILTLSLIHDGRFREARDLRKEVESYGYHYWLPWFRMDLAEHDWDDAQKIVQEYRKTDKVTAAYLAALLAIRKGDANRAVPEIEVLQEAYQKNKNDGQLQFRLWEAQGLLMCRTGAVESGLNLLAKAVERSKKDYWHHAWGNGAYYMELWGAEALRVGKFELAEEAFLEALAHDRGSVRGALGLQVLCEREGRTEEAERYSALARRWWCRAEVRSLDAELASLREEFNTKTQRAQRREENGKAVERKSEVNQ